MNTNDHTNRAMTIAVQIGVLILEDINLYTGGETSINTHKLTIKANL